MHHTDNSNTSNVKEYKQVNMGLRKNWWNRGARKGRRKILKENHQCLKKNETFHFYAS